MADTPSFVGPRLAHALCEVEPGPPCARWVVRAPLTALDSVAAWLGVALPDRPMAAHEEGSKAALRLGPDEWLVLDYRASAGADPWPPGPPPDEPVSVVDVTDRQVAILISGVAAADLLNAGAPLDLSPGAFPVGRVVRTVFGRVEVVIWRRSAERFHLEVWRSMASYVWRILALAHADIISDPASLASRPDAALPADKSWKGDHHA